MSRIGLFLLLVSTSAFAQSGPGTVDVMSARAYGMAGAFRSLGSGAEVIDGNPAALGVYKRYLIELSGGWDPRNPFGFGSVALIPLTAWFVYAAIHLIGLSYEDAFAFLHQPVNAIAMLLFVIASVIHMTLGLQVVIEDYVHTEGSKLLLFLANKAFGWIIGVACVFAILRIAL